MTTKRRRSDHGHEHTIAKKLVLQHTTGTIASSVTASRALDNPQARRQATHATARSSHQNNNDLDPVTPPIFTCFSSLPSELRVLIWRDAYMDHLDSQPSVCVYHGGTIPVGEEDDDGKPPRASQASRDVRFNHATPTVHPESVLLETVCREARSVCMAQRGVETSLIEDERQQSPQSGPVITSQRLPSRAFNPEIDTLYIDRQERHGDGSTIGFYLDDRTQWARHVRHLAVPFSLVLDIAMQPGLLRYLKSLESISFVLPTSSTLDRQLMLWSSPAIPRSTPARRIRLRTLAGRELVYIRVIDDPRRPHLARVPPWALDDQSVLDFMSLVETSIYKRIRTADAYREQLQSIYWSDGGGFRLDMRGCVFA